MWNEGVSVSAMFMRLDTANPLPRLQASSPAAPSRMLGPGSSPPSPLPSAGWVNGPAWGPGALTTRRACGHPWFLHFKGWIRLYFLVRFWVSGVNLWKPNCLINFCSIWQVNRRLITVTYPFIAVFLRWHLRRSSVTCLCCLLIIYQGFTSTECK